MIVPGDNYLRLCLLMRLHIVKNYALVTSMTSGMHFLHYIMLGVIILPPQQTGDIHPTSVESWPTVCDVDPAFTQPWANVSCLQGEEHHFDYVALSNLLKLLSRKRNTR